VSCARRTPTCIESIVLYMSLQAYVLHMYVLRGCGGMAAFMARHPRELSEPKHLSIHEEELVWHSDSDKMSHKACGSHGNELCCILIPPSVLKGVFRIARDVFLAAISNHANPQHQKGVALLTLVHD
jgi:hypothetical protein